tara:strand:+ start:4194 stop:4385 length:192 start_codon:yes stop_codon:yes gene_type:complete
MPQLKDATDLELLQEILTRKTEEGSLVFKEHSIIQKDQSIQLLGIMAAVEITLNKIKPAQEEE